MKEEQRKLALEARRKLSHEERCCHEKLVSTHLMSMPEVQRARVILSYIATREELSISAFHDWAHRTGKRLAFPVSGPDGCMDAYIPAGSDAFRSGLFGITEPDPAKSIYLEPEEIDVILVPCVAFDEHGHRLGHGGGYYDRYLPRSRAIRVLIAYETQCLPCVMTDKLDVPMNVLVTEQGIRYIGER